MASNKFKGKRMVPEYLITKLEEMDPSGGGEYTAGYGIDITDDEISVDEDVIATKNELSGYIQNNDTTYSAVFRGKGAYVKTEGAYTSTSYGDGAIGRSISHQPGYTYTFPDKSGTFAMTVDIITSYNDLTDKPTIPTKTSDLTNDSGFITGVAWNDVTGKPTFATVATSGDYDDLTNKPTIPAAQIQSDWNQTDSTKLDYIKNKPSIPVTTNFVTTDTAQTITGLKTIGQSSGSTSEVDFSGLTFKLVNKSINDSNLDLKLGSAWGGNYYHPNIYSSKGLFVNLAKIKLGDNGNNRHGITMPDSSTWGSDRVLATTADIPTVPTNVSAFTNDSGYITGITSSMVTAALGYTPGTSSFSGSYNDLTDKPTIPTVNDPTITFTQGGVTKGTISLNQATAQTIALDAGGGSTPAYEITNMVVDSTNQTITLTITQNN